MKKLVRDDIDKFFDYEIYVPTRTIFMGSADHSEEGESGTDGAMAERMIKALHILDSISDQPIVILMNNVGGDEYHGMAIYDAIKSCRSKVTIKVFGHAMSMGSIILQAADIRIMAPSARMMIHYGTWGVHDHSKIAYKWAEEGKKFDEWMENIYLDKIHEKMPEFKRKSLEKWLDHDTFFTASEAVKLGLCDYVLGEEPNE